MTTPIPNAPPDIDEQHALWGANCGPAAIAACLGITVADVRKHVEAAQNGKFIGYMNATHIKNAMRAILWTEPHRHTRHIDCPRGEIRWPKGMGVCVLQFDGPWCNPEVNPRARFRCTHSVASSPDGWLIYDVNAGVWLHREKWQSDIMADLVKGTKRATGWHTSGVIEVIG